MSLDFEDITAKADHLKESCGSADPEDAAEFLDITIMPRPFHAQKGVYLQVLGEPFIMIREDLDPSLRRTVLAHEIGHHVLHGTIAVQGRGFAETNLFRSGTLEREANLFAAEFLLSDEDLLERIRMGYCRDEAAADLRTDPHIIALKADILRFRGYPLICQECSSDFLKS